MIEITGYVALVLTIISFLMKDIIFLRAINLIACFLFVVYGTLINSNPVILTNAIIGFINIFYLLKNKTR